MGCGGSKEDVAAGNTAVHRRLFRKKSNASNSKGLKPIIVTAAETKKLDEMITAAGEEKKMSTSMAEGIRRVSNDSSSEQFFSPRKEVDGTNGGDGLVFFSPSHEIIGVGAEGSDHAGKVHGDLDGVVMSSFMVMDLEEREIREISVVLEEEEEQQQQTGKQNGKECEEFNASKDKRKYLIAKDEIVVVAEAPDL